jgi:sugar lactone lactonase YvrE
MTLLELLVVVVLIAIIIVPISNALLQGITLPAIDANRSSAAAARSLLTLTFDDDVAGAQSAMVGSGAAGTTKLNITCPAVPHAADKLVTLNWADNSTTPAIPVQVVYTLQYSEGNGTLTAVQLVRTATKGTSPPDQRVMLNGYCKFGPPAAQLVTASVKANCPHTTSSCTTSYGAYEQRVRLKVSMYDGPNDGLNSFSLEAAQRDTCASQPTPGIACGVMNTFLTMGNSNASFKSPYMIAMDKQGDIYISDVSANTIRELAAVTGPQWGQQMTAGNIYTVAGGGTHSTVSGVDYGSGTQCGPPATATASASACGEGGLAVDALLYSPYAVSLDPSGNLYIGDTADNVVRLVPKTDMPNGTWGVNDVVNGALKANHIYTVAGRVSGSSAGGCIGGVPATSTGLNWPKRVAFDSKGNMYLSDASNGCVRKVTPNGIISTVLSGLGHPMGLVIDKHDNLFVADRNNCRVLEVPAATSSEWGNTMNAGQTYVVAGDSLPLPGTCGTGPVFPPAGVLATTANLNYADDIALDADGNIYVSDNQNNQIKEIAATLHTQWGIAMTVAGIYPIAGTGSNFVGLSGQGYPALDVLAGSPFGVVADNATPPNVYYTAGPVVRKISAASDRVFTVAGNENSGYSGDGGIAATPRVYDPDHLATDTHGNVFIADSADNRVREWNAATGEFWTIAGRAQSGSSGDGGPADQAQLKNPTAVAVAGNDDVYILDSGNNKVRRILHTDGTIETYVNTPTMALNWIGPPAPGGYVDAAGDLALDSAGNLYIADTFKCVVRMVAPALPHVAAVFAGQLNVCGNGGADGTAATSAKLNKPRGVDVAPNGDVFIADTGNNRIRYVLNGNIYDFAGDATNASSCTTGSCGDGRAATAALLNAPNDMLVTSIGVYIADTGDAAVRKVPLGGGAIMTIAGTVLSPGTSGDSGSATQAKIAGPSGLAFDLNGTLYVANNAMPSASSPTTQSNPIRQVFSPE